jgi:hypothetical protein
MMNEKSELSIWCLAPCVKGQVGLLLIKQNYHLTFLRQAVGLKIRLWEILNEGNVMRVFRLSQQFYCRFQSPGILRCSDFVIVTDISVEHNVLIASIFWLIYCWNWRYYDPLKHWELLTQWYSITCQNSEILRKFDVGILAWDYQKWILN